MDGDVGSIQAGVIFGIFAKYDVILKEVTATPQSFCDEFPVSVNARGGYSD